MSSPDLIELTREEESEADVMQPPPPPKMARRSPYTDRRLRVPKAESQASSTESERVVK